MKFYSYHLVNYIYSLENEDEEENQDDDDEDVDEDDPGFGFGDFEELTNRVRNARGGWVMIQCSYRL
ncbi:uncharacterized protein EAE98_002790 [Botrytis deweyae]|uniref:Uncharacterized protein n=1 Tax=Botrytis deweyae TaxID=2478750 RepID=A0ABQ7IUQ6_9HELO|nr:uncharacterized protein EAE98_002790 [Botrytis deweyae]KAF7934745.1 hypothetical protein EAE98_002790 [Botrytis deweyae]